LSLICKCRCILIPSWIRNKHRLIIQLTFGKEKFLFSKIKIF